MKRNRSSIDGFIPRRPGAELGDLHEFEEAAPVDRTLHTGDDEVRETVGIARADKELGRSDIDESLRDIDEISASEKPTRKERRLQKRQKRLMRKNRQQRPKSLVRRIVKWFFILLLVAALAAGGYLAYRVFIAGNNVFEGNIFDIVQSQPLKEDENGRSNFLIFGTAEDSEGGTHEGGNLTDSIMVASVNQTTKDAYLISIPRDLWVDYNRTDCLVGFRGKINAVYFCGSNDGQDEKAGAEALRAKAGEILGLDVQYYVHLNFTAVIEAVDAVGGVEVTIETDDPRGILDRNFDWKCNYTCYYVNYEQGEVVQLDGEHALALARARNAAGGYGLAGGNFAREQNQQKVLRALVEKASSAGTLSNLGAVTGLIDALGNNLRTNIETKEIRTLMGLGMDIAPESILSLSLVNEDEPLVTTGNISGQSIVQPLAGLYVYTDIQRYVDRNLNASPVVREDPQLSVYNGGRAAGMAQTEADRLTDEGFTVLSVDNAPEGTYAPVEIYALTEEKPASAAALERLYGVEVRTTPPPASVVGATDFLIILGPQL
ncbi:MAG TPA: LCP family protein [Candidatus Saccharimonadaceae bacterium]|nr:LCP family protein [Candidatus Saccharimonadaceae bacterium]